MLSSIMQCLQGDRPRTVVSSVDEVIDCHRRRQWTLRITVMADDDIHRPWLIDIDGGYEEPAPTAGATPQPPAISLEYYRQQCR